MTKSSNQTKARNAPDTFAARYPNLAEWITNQGWIEIGYTDFSHSFVRVLDCGGMPWEGKSTYASIEAALQAAEKAIVKWTGKDVATPKGKQ